MNNNRSGLFLAGLFAAFLGVSSDVYARSSPSRSDGCRAPLRLEKKHLGLQRNLQRALEEAGYERYMKNDTLAIALVDLSQRGRLYYAAVNENVMMYAASLPKIVILLTAAELANKKKLRWTSRYDRRLKQMIVRSSNPDASWGAAKVGLPAMEKVVRSPRYCFYDDTYGGLWVGRGYKRGGKTNREPLQNLSHAATARQAARFYLMLDAGLLVSKRWSKKMLGLMSPAVTQHKFVAGLKGEKDVTFLARKSGSWRTFHSDSALITAGKSKYVAVMVSDMETGEAVARHIITILHQLIVEGKHRR